MIKKRQEKGITLVALVITIVILLILAGISISALTNQGLLTNAKNASVKSEYEAIKEEIALKIMEIRTDVIINENRMIKIEDLKLIEEDPKFLVEDTNSFPVIISTTKYEYEVNDKFEVNYLGKVSGIQIGYNLSSTEYTKQDVIITIDATSTEGTIQYIEVPEGIVENIDGTYTASQNGTYLFKITDSAGNEKTKEVLINNIDKTPPEDFTPTISNVMINGFKITANAVDNESGIELYEYHIGEEVYETTQGEYEINSLNPETEYAIYVVVTDKAGNRKQSKTIKQSTLDEIVDYETYINEHMQVDKIIYIDSKTGNNTIGNGTNSNPYATLDKIADSGIIKSGYSYGIVLKDGTYNLTTKIFNLTCNKSINIIGNRKKTKLKVGTLYGNNNHGGSTAYNINFYRLIWESENAGYNNPLTLDTAMNFYNIVFNITETHQHGYFCARNNINMYNCISLTSNLILRKNAQQIRLTNCYGSFKSGYNTSNSDWNYQTNYTTLTPQVDSTTYRIVDNESVWKNVGTGNDPDGSKADLGVYGGEYSWIK